MFAYSETSRGAASWRESIFTHKKKNPPLPGQIPFRKSMTKVHDSNYGDNQNPSYKETFEWGFSKIPRKIYRYAPMRKANQYAVWGYLLNHVTPPNRHRKFSIDIGGKTHWLEEGQLTTGIYKIEETTGVKAKTAWRILKRFESENLIEMRGTNRFTLITLTNSHLFQKHENQNEKQNRNVDDTDANINKKEIEEKEVIDSGLRKKIEKWFLQSGKRNPERYLDSLLRNGVSSSDLLKAWNDLSRAENASPSFFYGRALKYSEMRKHDKSSHASKEIP